MKKAFAITEYGYDKNGNVVSVQLPEGGRIVREYDVCDRLVKETMAVEANGIHKVTEYAYDKSGRVVAETDGFGYSVKTDYDKDGNAIRRTDKNGAVSMYFYDKDGNVVKEVRASNYDAVSDDGMGTVYTYDSFGRVLTVTNALGFVEEENTYDLAGRLVKKADGLGTLVEYRYDAGGRVTEVCVPWDGKEITEDELAKNINANINKYRKSNINMYKN